MTAPTRDARWFASVWVATFLLSAAFCPPTRADAPADDVWLVSTRNMPRCNPLDASLQGLDYQRRDAQQGWTSSDARAFHASASKSVPTIVFLHGNWTDACEAIEKADAAEAAIRAQVGDRPFRFVIWSWPADRVRHRIRDDLYLKADYCDAESCYLARWLDAEIKPGAPVSLVGHSFGSRIVAGAMHLLGGGSIDDQTLPQKTVSAWSDGKRNPVRLVLMAAALGDNGLAPDAVYGRALTLVDRALISQNPCDRVLRWYPVVSDHSCGDEALGAVGPQTVADNVDVIDVSGSVGRQHQCQRYCQSCELADHWARYTFLDGRPSSKDP
ncbi:MAG: hypothetical protein ABFC77_16200 [Thermoguttaceae bacterium]